ncbi:MAG TPA: glycosyl hydrolase family 28-related protein [Thermoanaerobaculia bacterium]|jgi:hypothetical protein|nr:glycosyl hydrolase family 28-related protein [Thermoanaerobaculia bacterium]
MSKSCVLPAVALAVSLLISAAARAQTNITCTPGGGLQCTPNPITGTGSIALSAPVSVTNGGTGSSSFTAGSIPFANGTVLTQDNANLFWDSAAHRLRAPLADLGGQVWNVKAYGAKGDGVTDDTASIQAAITAAGAGRVYLPAGNYKVSAALSLPNSGSSLVGAGVGATLITTSSATADVIRMGVTGSYLGPGVAVADLTITASVSRTGGDAIHVLPGEQFTIDNIRIQTFGGHGIEAGPSSAIIYASRIDAEIAGPFSAVLVNGGGEFHLSHSWLRGPMANGGTVAGSVGIDLRDGGIFASDVEAVQFERGVYVHPGSAQSALWSGFNNVLCDTNALYGWHFAGTGPIWGIECINCWAGTNAVAAPYLSSSGAGFRIENGDSIMLVSPRVINNGGNGIDVFSGTKNFEISGGFVTGNSVAQSNVSQGIVMEANTQHFRITNVRTGSAAGQGTTQSWGIFIVGGCDQYIISGNDTTGNVVGGINNVPGTAATRIVVNNL